MKRATLIAGLAALVLAGSLAIAAPANATITLSPIPTASINATWCDFYHGQMRHLFTVDGANLRYAYQETQRIYVHLGLKSLTTGEWIPDSTYYYGDSTGYDNPWKPQWDHVQNWYDAHSGQLHTGDFAWNINKHGTYQLAIQFAWDRSSAGASASGWTNWIWEPGTCTF